MFAFEFQTFFDLIVIINFKNVVSLSPICLDKFVVASSPLILDFDDIARVCLCGTGRNDT